MKYLCNIEVHETPSRTYAIGQLAPNDTRYRILKFDRTLAPPALPCSYDTIGQYFGREDSADTGLYIHDDGILYTQQQIASVLKMLVDSNDSVRRVCSCDALLGVVRFVEGYYLIAAQGVEVASLGPHSLRRVVETRLIPIANATLVKLVRRSDEAQFVASFQTLALQQDLYYSASYDLTRSLQHNILIRAMRSSDGGIAGQPPLCHDCARVAAMAMGSADASMLRNDGMFTWNAFHLAIAAMGLGIHPVTGMGQHGPISGPSPWFVPVIQGFVGQVRLMVMGRSIHVTLFARRSRKFAGARFLRRGVDPQGGWVANEVETEQIVHDGTQAGFPDLVAATHSLDPLDGHGICGRRCFFCRGFGIGKDGVVRAPFPTGPLPRVPVFTSFIQHRGSIPLLWSQDTSAMTPKPPITLNIRDPFFVSAAKHFNRMLEHYGCRVICFNLVKTREKVLREAILGDEFEACIKYLQQFIPADERLEYHHVDMSREAKAGRVIDVLEQRAESMVEDIGFFACGPEPGLQYTSRNDGKLIIARTQCGVIRTNCIDCLDRTNAAAFVIGKRALGHQLVHLAVLKDPEIPFDTEAIDLLTELYQAHGDAIALQYGGSALVNTMNSYRSKSLLNQSRDMLESAKRFWSNSFSDADKQDTIDIFLGVFQRWENFRPPIAPMQLTDNSSMYTAWRHARSDPAMDDAWSDDSEGQSTAQGLLSLTEFTVLAANRITSQSATPFKPHPPPDTTMMFDLGGLKKWLSARNPDGLFSRERASSMSSFFISGTAPDSLTSDQDLSDTPRQGSPIGAGVPMSRGSDPMGTLGATLTAMQADVFRQTAMTPASPAPPPSAPGTAGRATGSTLLLHPAPTALGVEDFPPAQGMATVLGGGGVASGTIPFRKTKKKPIEVLAEKLLDPETPAPEVREYRRYVHQFSAAGVRLERSLPLVDTHGAHAAHPDLRLFQRHIRLGAGGGGGGDGTATAPTVDADDSILYQACLEIPAKLAAEVLDEAEKERLASYESWINGGRLKPKRAKI
ncbi:SacI homology domain-containing protein [Blastocladiella britannica]|nr:SacI homology domain-containing protein [Blastocladiella britannica]